MEEWHLIQNLPKFYRNNKTVYVEVMFKDGLTDIAYFGKDKEGRLYCDTGYKLIDFQNIVKWRNLDLF